MTISRTRVVRWLRVLLPLAALAILSTLFLLGRKPGDAPDIPYAKVDAERAARQPRITAPTWSGVTSDGATLMLAAAEAAPDGTSASGLRLEWTAPDGLVADLTAPDAAQKDGTIALSGGVTMTTSTGWRLAAPRIDAATDQSRLSAERGVTADAPFGRIEAGAMALAAGKAGQAEAAGYVLNFTGGVRLLYQP